MATLVWNARQKNWKSFETKNLSSVNLLTHEIGLNRSMIGRWHLYTQPAARFPCRHLSLSRIKLNHEYFNNFLKLIANFLFLAMIFHIMYFIVNLRVYWVTELPLFRGRRWALPNMTSHQVRAFLQNKNEFSFVSIEIKNHKRYDLGWLTV